MQNPSGDENTGLLSGCPCPSTTACDGNNNSNNNNNYQTIPSPVNSQEAAALSAALSEVERRRNKEKKVLLGALVFCFIFMVIEFAAGIVAHSLALLTDAIHLLTDVGAYGLSIGALIAASQVACGKYNYGWHRAEVIGTLISVFSIWALVLWIVVEAFSRMYDIYMCSYGPAPEGSDPRQCHEINSELMILVGFLGMLVNITCAAILYFGGSHGHSHFGGGHNHSHGDGDDHGHDHGSAIVHMDDDHDHDHNHDHGSHHDHDHSHSHGRRNSLGKVGFAVNAALLHALGDCVQSVGVILAGLYIYAANRYSYGVPSTKHSLHNLADPFCSIMFAIITLNMTRSLLMDLLNILMESTPSTIDFQSLEVALGSIESVVSVHDLHVWSLSRDYLSLSVHLVADSPSDVLRKAKAICSQFGITHTTIQVDSVSDGSAMCVGSCGSPANCSAPGVEHTH